MYREDLRKKDIILPYALWTELLKVTPVPAITATATTTVAGSSKNSNGNKRHEQDIELTILTELLAWLLYQPAPSSLIPIGSNSSDVSSASGTISTGSISTSSNSISSELSLVEALEKELGIDLSTMNMLYKGAIIR